MRKPAEVLRLLFNVSDPVDRKTYFIAGTLLLLLKYAVDVAIVYAFRGAPWPPLEYLFLPWSQSLPDPSGSGAHVAPSSALYGVLAVWSLPFVWIGVGMTMRRLIDAGHPPGFALLFFVPIVKYLVIAPLCFARSKPEGMGTSDRAYRRALLREEYAVFGGVMSGVCVLVAALLFSVFALESYGGALFMGAPFVSAFVCSYVLARTKPSATLGQSWRTSMLALAISATAFFLIGWEGLVCLVMAAPLGAVLALIGALFGHFAGRNPLAPNPALILLVVWPLLTAAEAHTARPALREVLSVIEIERAPEAVWPHVVAFAPLREPDEWLFKTGIAYPKRARIEGQGAGAVRYCEFSTGAFVEPITVWDAPARLAFDVAEQPPTMQEWSPYAEVMAPHLQGTLKSRRGEFLLKGLPGNRTRIEARTWYTLDMAPAPYWHVFSDAIIHAIHMRVLEHVGEQARDR